MPVQMIAALHASMSAQCREALAPSLTEAGLSLATLEAASRKVAGKLLHAPTMAIKTLMADGDEAGAATVLASYGVAGWPRGAERAELATTVNNTRSVTLVARSGHRRHGIGRVRRRASSGSRIAS